MNMKRDLSDSPIESNKTANNSPPPNFHPVCIHVKQQIIIEFLVCPIWFT